MTDVLVIGAGPGGLAAAAALNARGVSALVVDKADDVGSAWRRHYDRLHLHTVRWTSHLPGYRIPRRYGPWVSRENVVRYLEDYTRHHRLDVRTGVQIDRLDRVDGTWVARSPQGDLSAPTVIVATGYNHTPAVPADWPGTFTGELRHASAYRNAAPYRGKDVLVVGTGNTGAEIAVDLVEGGAARARLAVRTVPTFVRRAVGPVPTNATSIAMRRLPPRLVDRLIALSSRLSTPDLSAHGLPRPSPGVYTRLLADGAVPIIDVGLIDAVQAGQVEVVGAVTGFDGEKVLIDGSAPIAPDAVIAATGYTQGLEPLVGHLGLLDDRGRPSVHGGHTHPHAPGLYFTGFTNPISGMFRELNIDARKIAKSVARQDRGAQLRIRTMGAGEALVLVHGSGTDSTTWDEVAPVLAKTHQVVTYDRRGYGESASAPVRDYQVHIQDLTELLESVGPAHLVGWSSGGNVALGAASANPQLVRTLTVVEPPFHGLRYPSMGLLTTIAAAKVHQVTRRPESGAAAFMRWVSGYRTGGNAFDRASADQQANLRGYSRQILAELDPYPRGLTSEFVRRRQLESLDGVPVTWMLGSESLPWFRKLSRRALRALPGGRTVEIDDASHFVHQDSPEAFITAVTAAAKATMQ